MSIVRTSAALALALIAVSACEPAKYQLLPLEVARERAPTPLVAETLVRPEPEPGTFEGAPVLVAGRYWQATATEFDIGTLEARPVATLDGVTFNALSWDDQPFDRLLVRAAADPGLWREFLRTN